MGVDLLAVAMANVLRPDPGLLVVAGALGLAYLALWAFTPR